MNGQNHRLATISTLSVPPHLFLLCAPLFWAGNFIVGRALRGDVPPVSLNFWRWVIALAILLPLNYRQLRQHRALLRTEWKIVVALGLTGVTAFNTFAYQALSETTAINALLFLSIVPVLMALGSRLVFNDVITGRHLIGILISLPGAAILIAHGDLRNLMHLQFNGGDLWMVGAVLAWTAFSVLLKRTPAQLPKATLLTAAILVGLGALMPIYAWRLALEAQIVFTASSVAGMLYVGLFASVLAFYFWSKGIAQVGPSRAGMYMHIMPLAGTFLSVTLLGEEIAPFHLVGAALVFTGIAITNWQSPGTGMAAPPVATPSATTTANSSSATAA